MDVDVELDTYKKSRQGLDEMYNEARRQLREECQLRQVCCHPAFPLIIFLYGAHFQLKPIEANVFFLGRGSS